MIPMIDYIVFGLWTLLCVMFGNWLRYRKEVYRSPMPGMFVAGDNPTEIETYEHRK